MDRELIKRWKFFNRISFCYLLLILLKNNFWETFLGCIVACLVCTVVMMAFNFFFSLMCELIKFMIERVIIYGKSRQIF